MSIEIRVPALPESVADATILVWHAKAGDKVSRDQNLLDLETDKVVLEVPAPEEGVLTQILKEEGAVVKAGELLAYLSTAVSSTVVPEQAAVSKNESQSVKNEADKAGPAARRLAAEKDIPLETIAGTGKSGRITRQDLLNPASSSLSQVTAATTEVTAGANRLEKRVPMTRLRARIAERLLAAQHNAAILTTFNEIDLHKVMELRAAYKDSFEKRHGTRLGFMSFFTKAAIEALKRFPAVNASIDGNDIVYHNYFDIGIAVSTERGLVVPIVRDADQLSFAEIEKKIADYGRKAKDNQIAIEDMTGGTFTITNGGVFGSLLATPIINPPQSAILGMNKIEERPVVEKGQIVIRPMMYVALSYDHRIIDGKESVSFLKTIKELLEEPARLLIDV